MFEIVRFHPRYQSGAESVILPIQREEFGISITLEDQPDLRNIPAFYQTGAGNFWLAVSGAEVVGTIALMDIGNGQAALRKMFVKKAFRGQRFGVGSGLLKALLDWCAEQRVHDVLLGTTEKFLAAHRFYEKNGFVEIHRSSLPQGFPVMAVDTKFYQRAIDTSAPNNPLKIQ